MRPFRKPLQLSYRDRTLRFTPEGVRFFFITLGVGLAALNTGNNLLYMVLAMMLSLIVVSGILSEQSVRKISLSRSIPQNIFAGTPFLVEMKLTNHKRFAPSFSIKIEDVGVGDAILGSHYLMKIPARQTTTVIYPCEFPMRGPHAFTGFRLSTRYPFGFFIKVREIRAEKDVLVYPRILSGLFERTGRPLDGTTRLPPMKKANEGDFRGLRDYRPGDDFRRIHWRSSAKPSGLVVREFETGQSDRFMVILDRSSPHEPGQAQPGIFETAVSIAATMILNLDRQGFQTRLLTQGNAIALGQGVDHVLSAFRILSLIQPDGLTGQEGWKRLGAVPGGHASAVFISARSDSRPGIPESWTWIPVADIHRSFGQTR
jgi:uncharacterized protein (DUF58 family)